MNRARDIFHRSLEHFHQRRFSQAEIVARAGLSEFPDDGLLWQLLGMLRQRAGDFEGASEALETASLLVPLDPSVRCALADCHARLRRTELARQLYQHLAQDDACPTALLPAVASGLGSIGDDATALDVCRELSRREPTRHEALFGIAFYMRRLGHPAESLIPVVARAHELAPEVTTYRVLLASLLANTGEHQEAYELLRDVPPESVRCSGCLRRMMAVFRLAGDDARLGTCREQAERIGDSGTFPPTDKCS
jgi:tetratricopeptide (TPR) repeat protein